MHLKGLVSMTEEYYRNAEEIRYLTGTYRSGNMSFQRVNDFLIGKIPGI
jgi:hypothetical protein